MARAKQDSLRYSRFETERLTLALLISLLLHLAVWGGYKGGEKLGWWEKLHQLTRLHQAAKKNPPPPAQSMEPEIFVDVDHVEPDPPKQTKYYSNKNSIAANPDAGRDEKQPKIDGAQKVVPKTTEAPRLVKLQPTPPQQATPETPPDKPEPVKPAPPASPFNMGDLQLAKLTDPKVAEQPPAQLPKERPRTLKAAQAQQPQPLPGQKLDQKGGVRRQRVWTSLDVKATAFGEYDRAIVEAVTQRWYDLLDSRRFAQDRTGKVILHFKLKYDGTITEMRSLEYTVGETLNYVCQEAVAEAAPFAPWPSEMRLGIGGNFREISFVFYYY